MTRQIPFLHWQKRADGTEVAHWKPSPSLRKAGFQNHMLGTRRNARDAAGTRAAMTAAMALNDKVAEWRTGKAAARSMARLPRKWRFADLVAAYRASTEWQGLGDKTQAEYNVRLRQLEYWAEEGNLPVRSIDKAMVADLKKGLLANDGSLFRCASTLRILRLLLNWAIGEGIIEDNATKGVKIPATPKRSVLLLESEVADAVAIAAGKGWHSLALGLELGLWSFQREADLLALTRLNWRVYDNAAPTDAAVLANARGDVRGFRLQQMKTRAWVDCPMPPWLHERIEAAFARSSQHDAQHLLYDDEQPGRPYPEWLFQRRLRKVLDEAGLEGKRFRDLRRSGMSMFRDLGVETAAIVTISGHAVIGTASVLDHYMPANTRAACAAMATALRARAAREAKRDAR
ncbi:site-specific integrase [Novosphingobium huizhouense]|uniref:site-specific integrase n=1 Tax=Novosphingobium huizhouense TaxID=2866625 RepID=UPI001CD8E9F1|nr:hypothetical protein [Novosphingobium huizhouense]